MCNVTVCMRVYVVLVYILAHTKCNRLIHTFYVALVLDDGEESFFDQNEMAVQVVRFSVISKQIC